MAKDTELKVMEPALKEFLDTPHSLVSVEESRAIAEVSGAISAAKRFPRDQQAAYSRIIEATKRTGLAKKALYSYPKGGQLVTGPSIRLAEVLAQNWGNLQFGIRELSQENGESLMEAFCWDVQTNVRQTKTFTVKHQMKAYGKVKHLTDARDVYEHTANQGARRVRACILGVIPPDIIEAAVDSCDRTLADSHGGKPLGDRVREMVVAFKDMGVTKEHLEKRLGHSLESMAEPEFLQFIKIYQSIKDNFASREAYFEIAGSEKGAAKDLNKKFKEATEPSVEDEERAAIQEEGGA